MRTNSRLHHTEISTTVPTFVATCPRLSDSIGNRIAITPLVSERGIVTVGRCFAVFQQNRAAGHPCLPVEAGAFIAHAFLPTTSQASSSLPTTIRR